MDKKGLLILSVFRKNARKNLTKISRATGIPVSTIYEKLKKYERDIIKKHTALLDFSKLGFDLRVDIVMKAAIPNRDSLRNFLTNNQNVNSLYRLGNGYDFLAECVFKHMRDLHDFLERLETYKVTGMKEFFILDDIKKEDFMTDPELFGILEN